VSQHRFRPVIRFALIFVYPNQSGILYPLLSPPSLKLIIMTGQFRYPFRWCYTLNLFTDLSQCLKEIQRLGLVVDLLASFAEGFFFEFEVRKSAKLTKIFLVIFIVRKMQRQYCLIPSVFLLSEISLNSVQPKKKYRHVNQKLISRL